MPDAAVEHSLRQRGAGVRVEEQDADLVGAARDQHRATEERTRARASGAPRINSPGHRGRTGRE